MITDEEWWKAINMQHNLLEIFWEKLPMTYNNNIKYLKISHQQYIK